MKEKTINKLLASGICFNKVDSSIYIKNLFFVHSIFIESCFYIFTFNCRGLAHKVANLLWVILCFKPCKILLQDKFCNQ